MAIRLEIYVRSDISIRRIKPYRHNTTPAKMERPVKIIQSSRAPRSRPPVSNDANPVLIVLIVFICLGSWWSDCNIRFQLPRVPLRMLESKDRQQYQMPVWRFRSPHHLCRAFVMRTSEPKPH